MNLGFGNLLGNLVFSGVGFVAFMYGKKQGEFRTMLIGGLLMVYAYFTPTALLTWLVGAGLTGYLWFGRA